MEIKSHNLSQLEQSLLDRIDKVRLRKENDRIHPTHAMLIHDLGASEENKEALRALCKKGLIKCHRTINDVAFVKI